MAAKRGERSVEELYNAADMIVEPKITSVLRGSHRMQGPSDETEKHIEKNTVPLQVEKRLGKRSMRQKSRTKSESGTCNVCSTPCSSCMHLNIARMGSKGDEFSDETCHLTATTQYSANDNAFPSFDNKASDSLQHTASEASNLLSVTSSHDSLSENAESKANLRSSDIADVSVKSETLPKLSSCGISGERMLSDKHEESKAVEGRDDSISCVSRANDASVADDYHKDKGDRNLACSSALASSPGAEESGKAQESHKSDSLETSQNDANAGSSSPKVETDMDTGEQSGEGLKCSDQAVQNVKLNKLVELPNMQECPLQSLSGDESDDSEIVEHDVKVCDICGDAGREDLLAICCRCSDGAEHTYCMREMLQKVPEGDWLCEECQLAEEAENQKQGSDAEGKRMNKGSMQGSAKRHAETVEMAPAPKRQAIETSLGSPKSSSPSKSAALSRDSSFKSLDKGKVKPAHQTSFGTHSFVDIPETTRSSISGPRLQTPKGTLLKSNSFSTLHSKPKVRPFDEVPQKSKVGKEGLSHDVKEGHARMISKSMSFKTSGRPNANESKVKMLSPKFSHVQDMKGLRQAKDRNAYERKNLSKLERPVASSVSANSTPKADQKHTPRGENIMASSAANSKESKATVSDGKPASLLRSSSSIARKSAEIPVRASSTNGMGGASIEQKITQVSPKDEFGSCAAERLSNNVNENMQDALPRSRESSNLAEKIRDGSIGRLRPAVTTGSKNAVCQKCKEFGHAAEHCSVASPRASDGDVSVARTTKEERSKGSKLKAAIEAAMLKKPAIYRKKKDNNGLSDGLSSSSMDLSCDFATQGQFPASNKVKSMTSDDGTQEEPSNVGTCSSDSYKQTNSDDVKQLNVHATDASLPSKMGDLEFSVGKPNCTSASSSLLVKFSTIPEHEYIWQGSFEVHRDGNLLDLHTGFQAHLSTSTSPKVLEVVNKFPQKITLDEAHRLSMWPRQFQDSGVKEDNIALYFFAKDIESYENNYKGLLDSMIKKDFALKGSFDGVELLIFPSTQLPENSQRWNRLLFLWGVFRGRRSNYSDSLKKPVIPSLNVVPLEEENPAAVLCLSENPRLREHMDREASASDSSFDVALASNAIDSPNISSKEDCDNKVSILQTNSEQGDSRLVSKSLSKLATSSVPLWSETRCTNPLTEEIGGPETELVTECKPTRPPGSNGGSNCQEETQEQGEASSIKVFDVGSQDLGVRRSVGVDKMDSDVHEIRFERDLNVSDLNEDIEEAQLEREPSIKGLDSWQSTNRKPVYIDLSETALETSSSTSQEAPWGTVDGESTSKKPKTIFGELYGCSSSRDGNSVNANLATQLCDLGSSSSVEEKTSDKVSEKKVILEESENTERFFFPVAPHHVPLGRNYITHTDEAPNLELALGAETKSPNKGILPFFVGTAEKNNYQKKLSSDKVTEKEEDDGVSASLSLSLSFPFPDKEQTVKPVSKTEQLLPDRHHVNTSLLLFGGLSDK